LITLSSRTIIGASVGEHNCEFTSVHELLVDNSQFTSIVRASVGEHNCEFTSVHELLVDDSQFTSIVRASVC